MRKKFTILTAALALLAMLAVPMGMWGQVSSVSPVDGSSYVVAAYVDNKYYALPNGTENGGTIAGTEITLNSANKVSTSDASGKSWTLEEGTGDNVGQFYFKYTSGNNTYYLYKNGTGKTNYNFAVGTTNKNYWSFTANDTGYTITAINRGTNNTLIQYNNSVFRCYSEATSIILLEIGDAPSYTITAQSNNTSLGTVALSGTTITATPASGCRYASPAYTVEPANSATVAQNGNEFIVTPSANTTVTINFEAIPTHTATFSVNGTTSTQTVAEGAAVPFPADPADIEDKTFVGWVTTAIDGTTNTAPTFVNTASETMGTNDVTFYAVFASVTPGTATTVTDELTRETTGVTSGTTTYSSWSGKTLNSDAVYAGNSAGGNNSIQLRTNNSNSGVVTTTSGGKAKKVTITWNSNTSNGRILDIYGKNSAYSAATELYNSNNQGTKLGSVTYGTSTELTITGDYQFIGMRSSDGAMYISSISIEWESISPDTYSDYCTTVIIPTVAKPTFSQASGEVVDGTVVTMSCTTEGATIYYSTDNGATWIEGNTYTIHENVTLKAKAVNGSDESQVVEATYTVQYILTIDMEHVEYFIFNYHDETWDDFPVDAEGRPLVHAGENVRVSVGSVEDCYTLQGLSVTFGENTIVPEYLSETEEYSFIMPASSATLSALVNQSTGYTLTVEGLENASFEQLLVGSGSQGVDLNNNNQAIICEQLHVAMVGLTAATGYVVESVTLTYGGQTTEITPTTGVYEFTMPSSNATLTITVGNIPSYTLVTSTDQLVAGKHYIMASASVAGDAYAMGAQSGNIRSAVAVTITEASGVKSIEMVDGIREFVLSGNTGSWTLYDKKQSGFLYASSSSSNNIGTRAENTDGDSRWAISFDNDSAFIIAQGNNTRNDLKYNYNNGSPRFSCYGSTSSLKTRVYLYVLANDKNYEFYSNTTLGDATVANNETFTIKKSTDYSPVVTVTGTLTINGTLTNNGTAANLVIEDGGQLITNSAVAATMQKNITAYDQNAGTGWYFIASPMTTTQIANTAHTNILSNSDLYIFDQSQDLEWQNYQKNGTTGHTDFTTMDNGKGYLYANSASFTALFMGTLANPSTGEVPVTYDNGAQLKGWNLVGNPFSCNAYLSGGYYVVNGAGNPVASCAGTAPIAPCTGAMVQVASGVESITFSKSPNVGANNGNLQMTVGQQTMDRGIISTVDNAIVSFNEGNELQKFYLGQSNANIYIPQGNKEFAIACAKGQGELPVNFRANADGQYTLTVNPEGIEMGYLHLIDNMTGANIDLLSTPAYTFNATTKDYESRFRLVFSANNAIADAASEETFAFFSNGSLIVNNEGEATLQVVDVMGRVVSNQAISGTSEVSLNQVPGVYVLRLISGDNVRTQKVIMK